ncbi:hypothetical protein GCM10011583_38270 [Streptomyces camponoticapitis]|uniref:Secreted protein n=1 Tax=Streptomyces camponoticapitis TaxID=1616125 RepID=A0ABQ2EDF6_9ACTN|nr:hypothetical protein [Streptomyces camponoticapitis]GGK02965.1 hypothetical protein GCM10011583_38270 [Streptomyces camponoticapitis]
MNIDWAALGSVFGVSLVTTVALVGLFTLGIVGLSKSAPPAGAGTTGTGSVAVARTGAYVCFGLCLAAVSYGIYMIVA